MKSLISLELRKQQKSFFGLVLLIVICLTLVTASLSAFAELAPSEACLLTTVVLQAFGLPLFGLLLGGGAGAQLRSSERKAEEDVPIRPYKRLLAAYIASLTYCILLAGLLFAISAPFEYSSSLQLDFRVPFGMVILLPLHSAAFVFSYWLSQALLGSTISAMIIGIPAYIYYPFLVFGGIDFMVVAYNALPGLTATSIHISFMLWLANRIERDKRTWLPIKMAISAVMMGALFCTIWTFIVVVPDLFDNARHNEFREDTTCNCRCEWKP